MGTETKQAKPFLLFWDSYALTEEF